MSSPTQSLFAKNPWFREQANLNHQIIINYHASIQTCRHRQYLLTRADTIHRYKIFMPKLRAITPRVNYSTYSKFNSNRFSTLHRHIKSTKPNSRQNTRLMSARAIMATNGQTNSSNLIYKWCCWILHTPPHGMGWSRPERGVGGEKRSSMGFRLGIRKSAQLRTIPRSSTLVGTHGRPCYKYKKP